MCIGYGFHKVLRILNAAITCSNLITEYRLQITTIMDHGMRFWEVFRNPGIKGKFKSWLFELICHWFWVVNGKRDPFTNELRPHLILHTRCLIEVLKEIWGIIGILNQKKKNIKDDVLMSEHSPSLKEIWGIIAFTNECKATGWETKNYMQVK